MVCRAPVLHDTLMVMWQPPPPGPRIGGGMGVPIPLSATLPASIHQQGSPAWTYHKRGILDLPQTIGKFKICSSPPADTLRGFLVP